jgi:hypothetical protein
MMRAEEAGKAAADNMLILFRCRKGARSDSAIYDARRRCWSTRLRLGLEVAGLYGGQINRAQVFGHRRLHHRRC